MPLKAQQSHRVVMVAYPQAQILDITGPMEVFARTSRWLRDHRGIEPAAYEVELVAADAGPLLTSGGLSILAARRYSDVRRMDTLLVAGGVGYREAMRDKDLLRWIARQSTRVGRLGS